MADIPIVSNKKNEAADTIESFFTSSINGNGTKVKAFTAANDTESSKSYKAYIFDQSGDLVNSCIPFTLVVRDKADYGASIVGQVIPAGGSLRVESSDAGSLNFYVTGANQ